jgi:hypothetical protein
MGGSTGLSTEPCTLKLSMRLGLGITTRPRSGIPATEYQDGAAINDTQIMRVLRYIPASAGVRLMTTRFVVALRRYRKVSA